MDDVLKLENFHKLQLTEVIKYCKMCISVHFCALRIGELQWQEGLAL